MGKAKQGKLSGHFIFVLILSVSGMIWADDSDMGLLLGSVALFYCVGWVVYLFFIVLRSLVKEIRFLFKTRRISLFSDGENSWLMFFQKK
ncbi:MAG: hypothetical protein U9Q63_02125 [Patescibacteria group bacterium]|nr:hypothetical protein [Patescibacteria group bacterium]